MTRPTLVLLLATLLPACVSRPANPVAADPTALREVMDVVAKAFAAINTGDTELWREVLVDQGLFSSVRGDPGERRLRFETFGDALANPPDRQGAAWLERMWDPTVLIDGDVATVWTRYDFHIDGEFSHGGVDVIVLLNTDDGWRIASFAWTVEPEPAEPSPLRPVVVS